VTVVDQQHAFLLHSQQTCEDRARKTLADNDIIKFIHNESEVDVVRHLVCSAYQVNLRRGLHQYFYHVKTIRYPRVVQQSEPFLCSANNPLLLSSCEPKVRITECVCAARFYFDEHERFFATVAADQVDFTATP